jgi:outer membrane protein assembly factor BamB
MYCRRVHTHALADDLRPRRSLWLSRRARWSASAIILLTAVLLVFTVVYRVSQRPYGFDRLDRIGGVALPAGSEGARAVLDGGRAFLGRGMPDGRYELRAVDADKPSATVWTNGSLADVETFRSSRGMVEVTGRPGASGHRTITLLNANNGVPFATFDVQDGDRWDLIGKYFVRYAAAEHRLTVIDVGSRRQTAAWDQASPAWWPTDNWSGQQVPTAISGEPLDEALTVDPHIVRETPDRGLEVVGLAGGHALGTGTGLADPGDLVYAYEDQIFVAPRAAGAQLRVYDRTHLTKPQWTWTSPDAQARPLFVSACGERRVCVGEEHHLTELNADTGEVVFRVNAERPSLAVSVGDRVMVRTATQAIGVTETLLDAGGRTVNAWPGKRAARLDEGSYLLLPAVPPPGQFAWTGVDASRGVARELGTIAARPDACTWSHTYLACATDGEFVFYRIRAPWYSL